MAPMSSLWATAVSTASKVLEGAKRRLQKFNGTPAHTFYLHLKECEWRFNNRQSGLDKELLKMLRTHPL